jgi:hypothetical protein
MQLRWSATAPVRICRNLGLRLKQCANGCAGGLTWTDAFRVRLRLNNGVWGRGSIRDVKPTYISIAVDVPGSARAGRGSRG